MPTIVVHIQQKKNNLLVKLLSGVSGTSVATLKLAELPSCSSYCPRPKYVLHTLLHSAESLSLRNLTMVLLSHAAMFCRLWVSMLQSTSLWW